MNQIKPSFQRPSSPPPTRQTKPSTGQPAAQEIGGLEDAYHKSDSGWVGAGALALAAMGLATVATGVVAQPAQAAEIDLAQDVSLAVEQQTETKELDLSIQNDFWGNLDYRGDWGDQSVRLDMNENFWGDHDLDGSWGSSKVDLEFDKTIFGNLDIDGSWGAQKVDLDVDQTFRGHNIEGRWGDAQVDLDLERNWRGNLEIEGRWGDQQVDLQVKNTWNGGTNIEGEWGGAEVDFTVKQNWRGGLDVDGEAPSEAFFPWLVNNHLQRTAETN